MCAEAYPLDGNLGIVFPSNVNCSSALAKNHLARVVFYSKQNLRK